MILTTALALAGLLGLPWLAHRGILHGLRAPRLAHAGPAAVLGLPVDQAQALRIPGPRGRQLAAWLLWPEPLPCAGTSALPPAPRAAVVVMHGWGAHAGLMAPVAPPLLAAGFAVLLLDARCHGQSEADDFSSLPRFAEDIAAGLQWLRQQPGIHPQRLAVLGHSVGAGAALMLAADLADRHPGQAAPGGLRAVVSLSAFAHPQEVMRRLLASHRVPWPLLGWGVVQHVQRVIGHRFDHIAPLATVARLRCPLLLVHGRHDATVPFGDALRLQRASNQAQLLAVAGDHDLREALAPHAATLVAFLQAALADEALARPLPPGAPAAASPASVAGPLRPPPFRPQPVPHSP